MGLGACVGSVWDEAAIFCVGCSAACFLRKLKTVTENLIIFSLPEVFRIRATNTKHYSNMFIRKLIIKINNAFFKMINSMIVYPRQDASI